MGKCAKEGQILVEEVEYLKNYAEYKEFGLQPHEYLSLLCNA
jgi:hypothetical protein